MAKTSVKNLELDKLKNQIQLMRQLFGKAGFIQAYFSALPLHKTNKAAFEFVNDLYFNLFGTYRYSDFGSFKASLSRYLNKNKK